MAYLLSLFPVTETCRRLYHIIPMASIGPLWLAFNGAGMPGAAMASRGRAVPSAQTRGRPWPLHILSLTHTIISPLGFYLLISSLRRLTRSVVVLKFSTHKSILLRLLQKHAWPQDGALGYHTPRYNPLPPQPCEPPLYHPGCCQQQQSEGTAALGHYTRWKGEGRGQEAKPVGVDRAGDSHADGLGQTQGPSCQNIHATASATPGLPGDPELAGCKGQSY